MRRRISAPAVGSLVHRDPFLERFSLPDVIVENSARIGMIVCLSDDAGRLLLFLVSALLVGLCQPLTMGAAEA